MRTWRGVGATCLLGIAATLFTPAHAQSPAPTAVHVNSFPGASNLPIWVAEHEGLFRRQGIAVTLTHPRGSVDQFKGLVEGRYEIVTTAFDNVIAYHEGQGSAEVGAIPDLVAVMGVDSGFLTLVAAPGIGGVADLKERTLAVDALSTGFSFALKDILSRGGVSPTNVSYVAAGSSEGRWKALQQGNAVAALLSLPTDLDATDSGYKALTTVNQVFGHYLANIVATRQGWAAGHRAELVGVLRGFRDGVAWLVAPDHKAAAIEILHQEMPVLDAGKLDRVFGELVDPQQGLFRNSALDQAGARTVLALRARYAPSGHALADVAAYMDTLYLNESAATR